MIPIPVGTSGYVKGVEFLPDNPKVLHHAFIHLDETRQSRLLAETQNPPGFDGMDLPETALRLDPEDLVAQQNLRLLKK